MLDVDARSGIEASDEPALEWSFPADLRAGNEAHALRNAILAKLTYAVGREVAGARDRDWFAATALAVRDRIIDRWIDSNQRAAARWRSLRSRRARVP